MDSHAMRYGAAAGSEWRIAFLVVILWLSHGVGCSVMGRRFWSSCSAMHIWWECVGVVVSMCAAFRTFQSWNLPPDGLQSVSIHIMNTNK